jgi:hypothetical protein
MISLKLRLFISLTLLLVLFGQTTVAGWQALAAAVDPHFLALAVATYLFSMILRGLKYHYTLSSVGVCSRPLATIGLYFRSVPYFLVPGVGEDRYRLDRSVGGEEEEKTKRAMVTMLDRLGNLWTLFTLSAIGGVSIFLSEEAVEAPLPWYGIGGLLVLFSVAVVSGLALLFIGGARMPERVRRIALVVVLASCQRWIREHSRHRQFFWSLVLGLLLNFLNFSLFNMFLGAGLGIAPLSLAYFMFFLPYTVLIHSLPIAYSGFGTRELGFVLFLIPAGLGWEMALAFPLVYYIIFLLVTVGTLLFYRLAVPEESSNVVI